MKNKEIDFKFGEEKLFKEFYDYVCSTYAEHYSGKSGQLLDEYSPGNPDAEGFCLISARKYLRRFGKKLNSKTRSDLLKTLHFTLLLLYFAFPEETKEEETV
jgi:hypothetical protein